MAALLPFLSALLTLLKALAPLAALAGIAIYGQRQKAAGGELEAAKADEASAIVETAIAKAEVEAPSTRLAVVDQLNNGSF